MKRKKTYNHQDKAIGKIKYRQTEPTNCVVYTLAHIFGDTFLKYKRKPDEYIYGGHNLSDIVDFLNKEKVFLKKYLPKNFKPVFWTNKTLANSGYETVDTLTYKMAETSFYHIGSK